MSSESAAIADPKEKHMTPHQWNEILSKPTAGYAPDTFHIFESGAELVGEIEERGIQVAGKEAIDLGSGNGRWAAALFERGLTTYQGLDIIPGSVEFCQIVFDGIPGFDFDILPVQNNHYYKRRSQVKPEEMVLDFPDNHYDIAIASSLYTHLETIEAAKRYLQEMTRVVKPGGILYCTFFTDPPNMITGPEDGGRRTVYHRDDVLEWMASTGEILDHWDGETGEWNDQVKFLCRKPE
jgi:SAM-dependent methyltransferase